VRLTNIGGGQDVTTSAGLTTAFAAGGEYANINMGNNAKAIVITSTNGNANNPDFIFYATSDGAGAITATLVGTAADVDIDLWVVGNFLI
jgi:hypothetical protein